MCSRQRGCGGGGGDGRRRRTRGGPTRSRPMTAALAALSSSVPHSDRKGARPAGRGRAAEREEKTEVGRGQNGREGCCAPPPPRHGSPSFGPSKLPRFAASTAWGIRWPLGTGAVVPSPGCCWGPSPSPRAMPDLGFGEPASHGGVLRPFPRGCGQTGARDPLSAGQPRGTPAPRVTGGGGSSPAPGQEMPRNKGRRSPPERGSSCSGSFSVRRPTEPR